MHDGSGGARRRLVAEAESARGRDARRRSRPSRPSSAPASCARSEEHHRGARQQGREMLDEAKATRERVLADLFRRRELLQSQIDELRTGRDHLLDAYRVVKRTFLEATEALAQVEARARPSASRAADARATGDESRASSPSRRVEAAEATPAPRRRDRGDAPTNDRGRGARRAADAVPDAVGADAKPIPTSPTSTPCSPGSAPARPRRRSRPRPRRRPGRRHRGRARSERDRQPSPRPADDGGRPTAPPASRRAPSRRRRRGRARRASRRGGTQRAGVLDPLLAPVASGPSARAGRPERAARRGSPAQGPPDAEQVLMPEAELLAAWVAVVRDALDDAYGAGRVAAGGEPARPTTSSCARRPRRSCCRCASGSRPRSTPAKTATPAGSSSASAPASASGRTSRSRTRSPTCSRMS